MNKRTASLLVLVVFALLTSLGLLSQSAAAQSAGKRNSFSARQKAANPSPSPSQIGFLSATQIPAGGGAYSAFPAVMGDFNGDGKQDVATMVNTDANKVFEEDISVLLSNGDGTFTNKLTKTPYTNPVLNPLWLGDLDGQNGDDLIVGIQATATTGASVDVWLGNGDGSFTFSQNYPLTGVNVDIVWGTVTLLGGQQSFVAVDANAPGNVWTLAGNGDGTFQAATSVAIVGQLATSDPQIRPGLFNPIAFGDFNGDGILDFAGPAVTTNRIKVYTGTGSGYNAPAALTTSDTVYHSCYLAAGNLSGHPTELDLVAANCYDGDLTVYVNKGTGTPPLFNQGVYSPASLWAGAVPSAVTIADIDGDSNNDVVSSNWQGADITVLLGDGSGVLAAPGLGYAIGGSAHINSALTSALVGDFNGDGHADAILQDSEFSFVYLQSFGTTPPSFLSAVDYQMPVVDLSYSFGIASGDFNGDKIPDFVVGNGDDTGGTTTGITVFKSNADGTLNPGVSYAASGTLTTPQLRYVAVADFDGDGNLDIAATDSFNGVVQIFTGNGNGTFNVGPTFSTGAGVSALGIAVGDFNGDKKPDLAVVNNAGTTSANVAILTNGSTPGSVVFTATQLPNLSTLATEITVADLNNDGKLDLIVPLWGTNATPGTNVAVLLGNGNGTFTAKPDFNLGFDNPYYATVGDFNGDGKVDIAVTLEDQTNAHKQGMAVALGNGDGTFQAASFVSTITSSQNSNLDEPFPGYVKAVDLDRDGKLDLVYTNKKYGTVGILYGAGDGTFYDPLEFAAGAKAYGLALADINGDGALDVVTSSNARDFVGVTVLLNTSGDTTVENPPSSNNVSRGTPVTFSANVTGSTVQGVTAVPTGTVSFIDNGTNDLGSGTLSGGVATLTSASLETGANSVVARYNGDPHYLVSTSATQMVTVTGQTGTTTALTSSVNPSNFGAPVTFSATVASTLAGDTLVPTGTVSFKDGSTVLGPGTLNSLGVATLSTSTLAVGTHSVTATYGGDTTFTGSTSAGLNQVVNASDYTLTANPTSPPAVNPGSAATITITVAPINGYNGTVSFAPASCTGLPTGASCSFKPSSVTGSGTTTLTISTQGASAMLMAPSNTNPHQAGLNLWASLGGVGMLGMILAGDWKKHNRRRVAIVLCILAVVMLLALAGCGSGSSSSTGGGGGGGGTPAGTYTIQLSVTGTVNTAPHSLTTPITLKVN
jgi:Bacterial Ig-like domain (group 3)/FG-GAP-like repeat